MNNNKLYLSQGLYTLCSGRMSDRDINTMPTLPCSFSMSLFDHLNVT